MSNDEVAKLAFGGAHSTARVLHVLAGLTLVGGLVGAALAFGSGAENWPWGIYIGVWGLLSAAVLDGFAWMIDLLRGILAGVWHGAWQLEDEEDDED